LKNHLALKKTDPYDCFKADRDQEMAWTVVVIAILFEISQPRSDAAGIVHPPATCRNAIWAIPVIRPANG
jgi:hypothetical protein